MVKKIRLPPISKVYPLITGDNTAQKIAEVLNGYSGVVNLTAGLCLIEKYLTKPPIALFNPSERMQHYIMDMNLNDRVIESSIIRLGFNDLVSTLKYNKDTVLFASMDKSTFSLQMTNIMRFINQRTVFWATHPIPIVVLTEQNRLNTLTFKPGERGYQRMSVLSQSVGTSEKLFDVDSKDMQDKMNCFSVFKFTPQNRVPNFDAFSYFLKLIMAGISRPLGKELSLTCPNSKTCIEKDEFFHQLSGHGKPFVSTPMKYLTPKEYYTIFEKWRQWPDIQNR